MKRPSLRRLTLRKSILNPSLIKRVNVRRVPRSTVPNSLTVLNMLLGFGAIIKAFEGDLVLAAWMVYFATFLDLLDGRVAKALNATSRFGAEFDSLTDIITFGVAPAMLMYEAYFARWEHFTGVILAFLPAVFSGMRLARFNAQWPASKNSFFQGIPTPISALYQVGFVAFAHAVWGEYRYDALAVGVVLSTSFLMVSNIAFESNVIDNPRRFSNTWKLIPFVLSILSVVIFGIEVIFIWAVFYILIGLIRYGLKRISGQTTDASPPVTPGLNELP